MIIICHNALSGPWFEGGGKEGAAPEAVPGDTGDLAGTCLASRGAADGDSPCQTPPGGVQSCSQGEERKRKEG